jgi:hypothetical protein
MNSITRTNEGGAIVQVAAERFRIAPTIAGTKEKEMRPTYGAQRLRATVLDIVMFVVIGSILAAMQAGTFSQGLAMYLIGGPLVALFASWAIALGRGSRAIADVAGCVQEQQSRVR